MRRRASAALPPGPPPACVRVLRGHSAWVVALDSVGTLLGSGSYDCAVRVWECGDLALLESTAAEPITALGAGGDMGLDGEVDSENYGGVDGGTDGETDGGTSLPDARAEKWQKRLCDGHVSKHVLLGHAHAVVSLCAVGSLLASGSYDHSIRLWCLRSGRCVQILHGHSGTVWAIAAQGSRCVSGAADNSLRVWAPVRQEERSPETASLHEKATLLSALFRVFCYALCALQGRLTALPGLRD